MNPPQKIFPFELTDKKTLLKEGKAEITINGNKYSSNASAYLQLTIQTGIRFESTFSGLSPEDCLDIISSNGKELSFYFEGKEIAGFLLKASTNVFGQECTINWQPSSEGSLIFGSTKADIKYLDFHLFNLINPEAFCGEIKWDGWSITFSSMKFNKDDKDTVRDTGGFLLTHMGRLTKSDGESFSSKDALDLILSLNLALSFAAGRNITCICPTGFDNQDNLVWQQWNSPANWDSVINWLPKEFNSFTKFLPEFLTFVSSNDDWRLCLREVIYWYVRANNSKFGVDAAIILAQTAIERLSYEYVVMHRKTLSYDGFKDLRASDKFRILFSMLDIPNNIPPDFGIISNLNKQWTNSAYALTDIRNSLVHPEHKSRDKYVGACPEAWNLSLWYLELCLLALCKYKGKYNNRSKPNNAYPTENVPWI